MDTTLVGLGVALLGCLVALVAFFRGRADQKQTRQKFQELTGKALERGHIVSILVIAPRGESKGKKIPLCEFLAHPDRYAGSCQDFPIIVQFHRQQYRPRYQIGCHDGKPSQSIEECKWLGDKVKIMLRHNRSGETQEIEDWNRLMPGKLLAAIS